MSDRGEQFEVAEKRLLEHYGIAAESRRVRLADPPLEVRLLETGEGAPMVLIHGSAMSAPTWAPMLAELTGFRVMAVDLPGFGLSDACDYSGRPLRAHAVAQLGSLLDALGLDRVPVVGTSLGAMWALSFAVEHPMRVSAVVSIGVPALALPGMQGDPFFSAMTTPVVGAVVSRMPPPGAGMARKVMARGALGAAAVERTPDEWFELVRAGMRMPGYRRAMRSHLLLAMRSGKPRPENFLSDEELAALATPVLFIWGEDDVYGGPDIGRRAVELMPDARLEVVPANHAPFLDDPAGCARLIEGFLRA